MYGIGWRVSETFWNRHSNPKSGWSRMLVSPVLLYAVYQRRWRLAGAVVVFTVVNPVLFGPPADDQAWMTRVVLAERWWTMEHGQPVFELSYPNVLNVLNIPVAGYAFIAAYRRRPSCHNPFRDSTQNHVEASYSPFSGESRVR
ncbi:DUF6653 family protein [Halopenitus persicus]|uniref:DUF6653 family protein n=1 Tax=Halopenitus persicus TaxID=1048396 RepID=UPI002AA2A9DD|nr:DUF6653 family protein [Halopenitus persicus]